MQRVFGPPLQPIPFQSTVPYQGPLMPMGTMPQAVAPFGGFPAQPAGGGGFLSKLLGGGASGAVPSGGVNLGSILTNTQRVLGLTQQAVPMVRQYGPLIRNLPAIWRIMREPDGSTPTVDIPNQATGMNKQTNDQLNSREPAQSSTIDGLPLPKLYI